MAESKSNSKAPKLMDVARPGKTAPPASAKPIIVTNRPIIKQDPMMVTSDTSSSLPEGRDPAELVSRASKPLRIEPLVHDDAATPASTTAQEPSAQAIPLKATTSVPVPAPAATPRKIIITPLVQTEPSKPAEGSTPISVPEKDVAPVTPAAPEPQPADPPKVDVPAETPAPAPQEQPAAPDEAEEPSDPVTDDKQLPANQVIDAAKKKEEEARATKAAEQEQLIASRKYYLPISLSNQRKGFWTAILLLIIVLMLAAVWLDVALDAGIVHINGVHPLTHFFNLQS